jgi:predicted RecB family nuclease
VFSATDIANFLACRHLLTLKRAEAAGEIKKPFFRDPGVDLLRELGNRHETAYLRHLVDERGLEVVRIPTDISWKDAVARTIEAIRRGADCVYQATFLNGQWGGRADFLVRVDRPSSLGDFSYEVVETKLARAAKARAILQLCFYSELLSKIQGVQPEWMHVVLGGDTQPEKFRAACYMAFFRKIKREFEEASSTPQDTYPEPVEFCEVCDWFTHCDERRRKDDHLSLVAGITRVQRKGLRSRDIDTVTQLAELALPVVPKFDRIGEAALDRLRDQAALQVEGRNKKQLVYKLLEPIEEQQGLAALPLPSPGDIFLDFEAVPHAFDTGLEYLVGMALVPEQPGEEPTYQSLWSFGPKAEKEAFERLIATIMKRRKRYPDLHIYHYAPYEQTAIKRLAGRHGCCTDEVDQLLRAGTFVDLYRVVRQALRASVESYSIKKLEALYGFARSVPPREAVVALQTFEAVLTLGTGEEATKDVLRTIQAYNRDDCLSALRLRDWLEDRRRELEAENGQLLPRLETKSGEPNGDLADELDRVQRVMADLLDGLPSNETEWTDAHRGRWLLAQMLEWHRREEKSSWWEYFRLCGLSDSELQEDKTALGGLTYLGVVGQENRSLIHRYSFPPQDHAMDRARSAQDPRTEKSAGTIVNINEQKRTIDIKRGACSVVPHPTALVPRDIVGTEVQRESLLRLGSWVAENGIDGPGPFRAERDLLLRRAPRLLTALLESGNDGPNQSSPSRDLSSVTDNKGRLTETAKELVLRLAEEACVLPVQGPPGSGKTFTGARMIVELVKHGRRVGITAASHKVISLLLHKVCVAAREAGVPLRAVQKSDEVDGCADPMVELVDGNQAVLEALRSGEAVVAAGTAWLWAREEMADSVDVLFIDEAGQMSLANVLAVAQAATSSVLLGDPRQLNQPQKGIHPPGADGSAFDHLLQDRATITEDQGLFLTETHRLHPDVCSFISELFYEGRLQPRPENQRQRLNTRGALDGTGLRFVPVAHSGNQIESQEEVERISTLIGNLLSNGSSWTNKEGATRDLRPEDILVVAPYNAQVAALREKLSKGVRVGTVDKFQGQEAPIVFYSMTTSSPEDAPRGMEFLYSLNRLNVAVSRARCVAVIVASPALFQAGCKSPRQIELANAFCRYLEMAE